MNTPVQDNEESSSVEISWPDGSAEPPNPRILVGMRAVLFYAVNLAALAVFAAPILVLEPLALQGLDCFLYRHEGWMFMRLPLGLGIALTLIVCAVSVTLLASVWMYRKWIGRFGWDEFSGYLFHDRWQRMGTIGRNLNAFLLRQARK